MARRVRLTQPCKVISNFQFFVEHERRLREFFPESQFTLPRAVRTLVEIALRQLEAQRNIALKGLRPNTIINQISEELRHD